MTPEQITTIVSNVVQGGSVLFVGWCWIRGLKVQIVSLKSTVDALQGTISAQKQTLEVMERRIGETDKITEMYRSLIDNYPEYAEKTRAFIVKQKDALIEEQGKALASKDDTLRAIAESKLNTLEMQEAILLELPSVVSRFQEVSQELQARVEAIDDVLAGAQFTRVHFTGGTGLIPGIWSGRLTVGNPSVTITDPILPPKEERSSEEE